MFGTRHHSHTTSRSNLAGRMGRWSAAHWKTATFGWLAMVVVAFGLGGMVGMKTIDANTPGPGESGRVDRILDAGFKQPAGESVLIQSSTLRAGDPEFAAAVRDVVAGISKLGIVQHVRSPLAPGNGGQIAPNGHAALVELQIRGDPDTAVDRIGPVLDRVAELQKAHPQLFIGEFGDASKVDALVTAYGNDLGKAGLLSLPVTLIILLVAFGALVAAGIPLLLALTAVFATFGLISLPSHVFPVAMQAPALVLLIGLAVGVDYSMFYLKREREERAAGRSEQAALEAAAATSGRSVLIAGLTVIVAMAGMFLTGDPTFESLGVAAITVVAIAVLGSLTVLPALLSRLGDRVDRGRLPLVGRRRTGGESRIWGAIVDRVLRRPLVSVLLAGGLLLALALPALQLRMAMAGPDTFPQSLPAVQAYERMQQAFPGTALPANVVVKAADVKAPAVQDAIRRLEQQALASGRMHEPITVDVNRDATVANVSIPIDGKTTDREADAALAVLRDRIVPDTVGRLPKAETGVTGLAAQWKDSTDAARVESPAGGRLRARHRVRAAARCVPLPRRRDEGDAAQPPLRRCGVRRAGAGLPARDRQGPARLQLHRGDRPGRAAAPLRDPVRPLDGLPRPRAQPDQGAVRQGREHGRRDLERDQADRRRRHQRRGGDGVRVLDLRDALDAVLQAVRRRARSRDPDRRDDRPGGAPAREHEAARRLELVPPALARVAAAPRAGRARDRGCGSGDDVGVDRHRPGPAPPFVGPGPSADQCACDRSSGPSSQATFTYPERNGLTSPDTGS